MTVEPDDAAQAPHDDRAPGGLAPMRRQAGHATEPGRATQSLQHHGAFFGSAAELAELAVPWLRDGIEGGDHVVAALRPKHAATVRAALTPEESARVTFTPHSDFYDAPGRTLALMHRLTMLHHGRGITIAGEPDIPLHDPLALREWHGFDSVLDAALAEYPIRLLCLHDTTALPSSERTEVLRTHSVLASPGRTLRETGHHRAVPIGPAHSESAGPMPLSAPHPPVRRLDVDPDLPALRDRIIALAAEFGLTRDRTGDLVVAVNELAANVLEHGAGSGTIAMWRSPGGDGFGPRLVCDVHDAAGGLTEPLSGYFPTDALSVRGYGLWITRQVCDFMEVRGDGDGSLVRLHFTL